MMDNHSARIVGSLEEEIEERLQQAEMAVNASRRPLRPQRVFTEADEAADAPNRADDPTQKKPKRRGTIKQLPLHIAPGQEQARARANSYPAPQPAGLQARLRRAAQGYRTAGQRAAAPLYPTGFEEQVIKELALDIARRIQKVTTDLLVGAAVVTASVAELTGNLIALLGLLLLLFPGQFVHTTLMALLHRLMGQERDFGDAFSKSWKLYRNILNTHGQLGPYQISLSFVVGLSLVGPLLLLKFLELANMLIRLFK